MMAMARDIVQQTATAGWHKLVAFCTVALLQCVLIFHPSIKCCQSFKGLS